MLSILDYQSIRFLTSYWLFKNLFISSIKVRVLSLRDSQCIQRSGDDGVVMAAPRPSPYVKTRTAATRLASQFVQSDYVHTTTFDVD